MGFHLRSAQSHGELSNLGEGSGRHVFVFLPRLDEQDGCVALAPLGLPAGEDAYVQVLQADLQHLTKCCVEDEDQDAFMRLSEEQSQSFDCREGL